jgi:hypothetical protein
VNDGCLMYAVLYFGCFELWNEDRVVPFQSGNHGHVSDDSHDSHAVICCDDGLSAQSG